MRRIRVNSRSSVEKTRQEAIGNNSAARLAQNLPEVKKKEFLELDPTKRTPKASKLCLDAAAAASCANESADVPGFTSDECYRSAKTYMSMSECESATKLGATPKCKAGLGLPCKQFPNISEPHTVSFQNASNTTAVTDRGGGYRKLLLYPDGGGGPSLMSRCIDKLGMSATVELSLLKIALLDYDIDLAVAASIDINMPKFHPHFHNRIRNDNCGKGGYTDTRQDVSTTGTRNVCGECTRTCTETDTKRYVHGLSLLCARTIALSHNIYNMSRNHCAIDLVASEGEVVYAPFTGVVKWHRRDSTKASRNYIDIEATTSLYTINGQDYVTGNDFSGFWVRLMYVSADSTLNKGDVVCAGARVGQVINVVDDYGCSTGSMINHLHLEMYRSPHDDIQTHSTRVNPTNYLRQAEPRLSGYSSLSGNCPYTTEQEKLIKTNINSFADWKSGSLPLFNLGSETNDENEIGRRRLGQRRNDADSDSSGGDLVLFSACFPVYWIIDVCVGFRCVYSDCQPM